MYRRRQRCGRRRPAQCSEEERDSEDEGEEGGELSQHHCHRGEHAGEHGDHHHHLQGGVGGWRTWQMRPRARREEEVVMEARASQGGASIPSISCKGCRVILGLHLLREGLAPEYHLDIPGDGPPAIAPHHHHQLHHHQPHRAGQAFMTVCLLLN